jgi:hypothetical protein
MPITIVRSLAEINKLTNGVGLAQSIEAPRLAPIRFATAYQPRPGNHMVVLEATSLDLDNLGVTAVVPFLPVARGDRRTGSRNPALRIWYY